MFIGAVSNQMFAQIQKGDYSIGAAASLIVPTGDFSSKTVNGVNTTHGTGFGISAIGKYGLSDFLTIVGDFGWNATSQESKYVASPKKAAALKSEASAPDGNYNYFNFTAGLRANVSFLYGEVRAGYYTGDLGGFGFVPAIGAEFGKFDVQANYTFVNDLSSFGIRLGYYFM
jgi:hypothetical protein